MRREEDGLTGFDLIKLGKGVGLRGVWATGGLKWFKVLFNRFSVLSKQKAQGSML